MKKSSSIPKKNRGSDFLIPKKDWVDARELQYDEFRLMSHPVILTAFNRILEDWKPRHKVCLISLCAASKPFSLSKKWKKFIELYGNDVDLIVCSSGGIIPQKYWECYPFMTYDVEHNDNNNRYYIRYVYRNLMRFFEKNQYEKIVLNFRPRIRNRVAAQAFKRDYKGKAKIYILPTEKTYKEAQKAGFPMGKMFPDIDPRVLAELSSAIYGKGSPD